MKKKVLHFIGVTFFIWIFIGCSKNTDKSNIPSITIDLKEYVSFLPYSHFADSVSYLTLKNQDSLLMWGVERLYLDDHFIFLEDQKRGGIFVFSPKDGSFVTNLNYFGQGPEEFRSIQTFTLDRNKKQIIIFSYPFLHKYTYDGMFIERINTDEAIMVDFHSLNTGEYLCIVPEESRSQPEGIWLADPKLQYIKTLKQIPSKQLIFVRGIFYNGTKDGLYYYDPVWEDFSYINRDSVQLLYKFDFKQRIPQKERNEEFSDRLRPYSFISKFAHSNHYILINYFNFDQTPSYWVLLDKQTQQTVVSNQLVNDFNEIQIAHNNLFYVDNKTWCRVLDFEENNSDITLEFIHLKP